MAYQVIKTIHGKKYLYLQNTYREGGKVKTENQYIGAIDSSTGELLTPQPKAPNTTPREQKQTPLPETEQPKPSTENVPLQKPTFKINNDRVRISQNALIHEHKQVAEKLKRYEISPAAFPKVIVKHGKECKHYKPAFKNALVVTIPKTKGGREALRREYRYALHRGFIETLERQAPEKLAPFKYAFDTAYRNTQKALNTYLWNCTSSGTFARIIALKWFSVMNPVPTGKRSHLPPEKLGLTRYGKRGDWKTEFTELMAQIDKKGIEGMRSQAQKEIATAQSQQKKTIQTRTIFFLRKRKKVKRLQARIDANSALLDKLSLVERFGLV